MRAFSGPLALCHARKAHDENREGRQEKRCKGGCEGNCVCHTLYMGRRAIWFTKQIVYYADLSCGRLSGVAPGCLGQGFAHRARHLDGVEAPLSVEPHMGCGFESYDEGSLAMAGNQVIDVTRLAGGQEAAETQKNGDLAHALAGRDLPEINQLSDRSQCRFLLGCLHVLWRFLDMTCGPWIGRTALSPLDMGKAQARSNFSGRK